jgi:hypothetical protein
MNKNIFCLLSILLISTFSIYSQTQFEFNVDGQELNRQLEKLKEDQGSVIITFVGYSGKGYENESQMLDLAKKYLRHFSDTFGSDKVIVNIGVTSSGIGAVYPLAKDLRLSTMGIVSVKAKPYLEYVKGVDIGFLIEDSLWGGYKPGTKILSPTSKAMVNASDVIIALGGGDVAHDELTEARKRFIPICFHSFEMNKAKAIKKAQSRGLPEPTYFYGGAQKLASELVEENNRLWNGVCL